MKQVVQSLRSGEIRVADVPDPALSSRYVLVRNAASVISAGTEKTKVDMGRKSLLGKAAARPDLVRQVLKKLRTDGFAKTLQTVRSRMETPNPLGYSSAGRVLAAGGEVTGLQKGDRVACAGAGFANHAEVVAVPRNLVARVPDSVSDEEAAFATVGAIALQGLRLAEPKIGETFLVLGLGLLGQIAVQLLRANGCRVIGTDLDPALCKLAEGLGAETAIDPAALASLCAARTGGHGVDGVIVCAGTSSNQPIELCGEVTREKGRVVVVGAVGMDVPREPYFRKEIALVISRSYGPGRYDPRYEEEGSDYPYGYVRFTEQRNLETFLDLLASGAVDVKRLITHRFAIEAAPQAYELLAGKPREPYLGVVLTYAPEVAALTAVAAPAAVTGEGLGIAVYGAGNYATASLLPVLQRLPGVRFAGIATASGRTAQDLAARLGFAFAGADLPSLLTPDGDALLIATRHDTHASATEAALRAGKHVYVEKPLALTLAEWRAVRSAWAASGRQLMVGFNRRFAPLTRQAQAHFAGVATPLVVAIRVNAGAIPADHWIQSPSIGGGRLVGEACHFIDLAAAIAGGAPLEVSAIGSGRADRSPVTNDNVVVTLRFANGSIASVAYVADGSTALAKEQVEIFGGGRSAVIGDFRQLDLYADGGHRAVKLGAVDKGQGDMLRGWVAGLRSGAPCVPAEELFATSLATLAAVESLQTGQPVVLADFEASE
ncbi:bi-domain-containing oxidoreductase [Sphingoaurantiacus capsulatus]|uniref:Bi-domain-containing oxidoreductase n=1 Tax=Sphingoaurantiacus capsulatus TaxID=1771310 RepID=A0ABV7XFE2_9SPHN